jgi:hypothetical protein
MVFESRCIALMRGDRWLIKDTSTDNTLTTLMAYAFNTGIITWCASVYHDVSDAF